LFWHFFLWIFLACNWEPWKLHAIPRNSAQFKNINFAKQNSDWKPSDLFTIFFILKRVNSVIFCSCLSYVNLQFTLKTETQNSKFTDLFIPPHLFSRLNLSYICTSLCLSFFLFVCMSDHNFRTPALTALHLIFLGNYGNIFSFVNTSKFKV